MNEESRFPYQLINSFFISLEFHRDKKLPNNLETPISLEAKVLEPGFPRVQLNIRASNPENGPLYFALELVGLFDYAGNENEYNHELNLRYLSERGFFMLWPQMSQMIRIVTGQMGVNPLNIQVPMDVELALVGEKTGESRRV